MLGWPVEQPQRKAPGASPGLCNVLRGPVLPELVVHAGAPDVVLELDLARRDVARGEGTGRERVVVIKLDIQKFALDRPAVAHRVFDAATDGPTAAGIALLVAALDWSRGGEEPFRGVDLGPGAAAGDVDHCFVSPPAPATQAEPAARGHEPALLGLRSPVIAVDASAGQADERDLGGLTRLVERRSVALDAEHPHAPLPVAAALEAAITDKFDLSGFIGGFQGGITLPTAPGLLNVVPSVAKCWLFP